MSDTTTQANTDPKGQTPDQPDCCTVPPGGDPGPST